MLAVSSLTSVRNERSEFVMENEFEAEFSSGNLLDSIDFDDIFVGIEVLPDLEVYQDDFLADFSVSENDSGNSDENNCPVSGSEVGLGSEIMSKREVETGKIRKSSSKKPPAKKKTKVDWTAELHRRFVEAVEQLGIDKAVPSRILEIMGVHTLTRHNIASHLQKYRSHRKHLVAREAEAAQWSQRQQMYGSVAAKREVKPWIAPTMGFPPMPHFRPLHVWGHPSVDQSLMATWPKHVAPPPPPHHHLPPWPPAGPTFWHSHHQYVPTTTTGTPCFPPPQLSPTGFPISVARPGIGVAAPQTLTNAPAASDVHPSTESIDAAIGDVIAKPWLPLPLGLKPPSIDCVMSELQRQGVSKIPQTSTSY